MTTNKNKVCKLCGKSFIKLSDSHIIPRAFFEYIKGVSDLKEKETMLSITNTKGVFPYKKMTIGRYDNNLVCEKCEKIFGPYDDYAIRILLKQQEKHRGLYSNGKNRGWFINDIDSQKLNLFFISVLWRALASDLPEYKRINSEECLIRAKDIILSGNIKNNNDFFSVILARYVDKIGSGISVDPYIQEIDNTRFFKFYPGAGYVFFIKADKTPLTNVFLPFTITENKPLFILNRGFFLLSKECEVLEKVISEADKEAESFKDMKSKFKK